MRQKHSRTIIYQYAAEYGKKEPSSIALSSIRNEPILPIKSVCATGFALICMALVHKIMPGGDPHFPHFSGRSVPTRTDFAIPK
jgi:hypothetical protein